MEILDNIENFLFRIRYKVHRGRRSKMSMKNGAEAVRQALQIGYVIFENHINSNSCPNGAYNLCMES